MNQNSSLSPNMSPFSHTPEMPLKKRGRKSKEITGNKLTNIDRKKRLSPSSNGSNTSFSELSTPSSSRKNSADLSDGIKIKKIKKKNLVIPFNLFLTNFT